MLIHGIIHVLSYWVPCKSVHVKRCNHRHYQGRLMGQQTHVLWMVNHWLETVSQRFVAFNVLELLWFPGLGSKDAETTFIKMLLIIDQVLVFKPGRTRPLLRTNAFVFSSQIKLQMNFQLLVMMHWSHSPPLTLELHSIIQRTSRLMLDSFFVAVASTNREMNNSLWRPGSNNLISWGIFIGI